MGPGKLQTSILRGAVHLRAVGLLSDVIRLPDFSDLTPGLVRKLAYPDLWQTCIQRRWYNLRLNDESFFQFRVAGEFSYSFYEAPVQAMTFEEFARHSVGEEWEVFTEELREEYEVYVSSLPYDWPAVPVRFDYSPSLYRSPCHPAAHIHFGYSSQVRIATRRILTPEAFVLFVIRQYYPDLWPRLLCRSSTKYVHRVVREALPVVDPAYWHDADHCEMHFD